MFYKKGDSTLYDYITTKNSPVNIILLVTFSLIIWFILEETLKECITHAL